MISPTAGARRRLFVPLFALFLGLAATLSPAAEPPPPDVLRLEATVRALREALLRVATQQQVDRSASLGEIDRQLALAGKEPALAGELLQAAYVLVKSDLRLLSERASAATTGSGAATEAMLAQREHEAFARQRSSVLALREALTRIAGETRDAAAERELAAIGQRLGEADALAKAGKVAAARQFLQQGLETAKLGIQRLRGGTTQVRALVFASKEEEYRYELDRYEAYQMLRKLLVPEEAMDARLRGFVARAGELRGTAEDKARRGDYAAAVTAMEDANREYLKAIRGAGVMIPG